MQAWTVAGKVFRLGEDEHRTFSCHAPSEAVPATRPPKRMNPTLRRESDAVAASGMALCTRQARKMHTTASSDFLGSARRTDFSPATARMVRRNRRFSPRRRNHLTRDMLNSSKKEPKVYLGCAAKNLRPRSRGANFEGDRPRTRSGINFDGVHMVCVIVKNVLDHEDHATRIMTTEADRIRHHEVLRPASFRSWCSSPFQSLGPCSWSSIVL